MLCILIILKVTDVVSVLLVYHMCYLMASGDRL